MRTVLLALLVATAACLGTGCAMTKASAGSDETAALSRAQIQAVVANADRSDADRRNDVRRKPVEMLSFPGPPSTVIGKVGVSQQYCCGATLSLPSLRISLTPLTAWTVPQYQNGPYAE